jgi:pimeloyl-ACP methyl ester carboxylesterase
MTVQFANAMAMSVGLTLSAMAGMPAMAQDEGIKNVVLVHGAWADGSGWRDIYEVLKADGYNVSIVQNPLTSLADDVAATDRVLDRQDGPTVLVGHSYGGAVITEAGDHENVAALVYVEAFVPDVGETVFGLIPQEEGAAPPFEVTDDGFVFFSEAAFVPGFADSVDPSLAEFMMDSQVPISFEESGMAEIGVAAWKDKPSWYQMADADHVIPPAAQRMMSERAGATLVEVSGGHLAFIAHAQATADLIKQAATDAGAVASR